LPESTTGAAVDPPVWVVSDAAAPAALDAADFEVSTGPPFPWLALESRVAPPVLLCALSHDTNIDAMAILKISFFMAVFY
jgi:hypothetical protein